MPTPEFILKLREKVGHGPLWRVGITAYVEDDTGRILLGRRADTGEWALVYGINEPGEEPADTVAREVLEETSVNVVPAELASVKASDKLVTYENGDQTRYLDLLFICRPASEGNAVPRVNDDESLEVGWFKPDALPQPLAASTIERLAYVKRYRENTAAGNPRALFSSSMPCA